MDSKGKILTTNVWSSELSKLASNAMLVKEYHQLTAYLQYVRELEPK